jgi:hypothetical protein
MSQNPDESEHNPNPYGPNPMPPPYPGGIHYGGPPPASQPLAGPHPPDPGPGPCGNLSPPHAPPPPASYPYANPETPPPPLRYPYGNSETPIPPGIDPNASTVVRSFDPAYSQYFPSPPIVEHLPIPPPPQEPPKPLGLIIALVVAVILVIGGSIIGVVAYNNHQNAIHADATATAVAQTHATATAIASTYPFSNKLVLDDPMVGPSNGRGWDNDGKYCSFSGSAYHVFDDQEFTYWPCVATLTNLSNFTFQAETIINQGNDLTAAGLIFRANKANDKFYRFVIDGRGICTIWISVDPTGKNTRDLKDCSASQFNTGLGSTNTIGVVANNDQISIYINQQLVTSVNDSTYSHGQIGLEVDNPKGSTSPSEAIFSNVKVWVLPA